MMADIEEFLDEPVVDRLLIGLAALIVVVALGIALYGIVKGFVPTSDFASSNTIVALIGALIVGLCGLAVVLEVLPPQSFRLLAVAAVMTGGVGYFAASKGIPALYTNSVDIEKSLTFNVVESHWGSKSCRSRYIATHPGYARLPLCAKYYDNKLHIGGSVEVRGKMSDWGIVPSRIRVAN